MAHQDYINDKLPEEMVKEIKWLINDGDNEIKDEHVKISAQIYKRLVVRHALLHKLEEFSRSHQVHEELDKLYNKDKEGVKKHVNLNEASIAVSPCNLEPEQNPDPDRSEIVENSDVSEIPSHEVIDTKNTQNEPGEPKDIPPALRAYRLAVTDLFVEKALAYLEGQAKNYKRWGVAAYVIAFIAIALGTGLAVWLMLLNEAKFSKSWLELLSVFMRGFTAYGMIVLTAVALSRFGKAMLDQAERLLERRHALRQGRLFVHLNKGRLSINELESAFNWNTSQSNAFGNLSTDAKAPMGALAKEFAHIAPELMKASIKASTKNGKGKTEN